MKSFTIKFVFLILLLFVSCAYYNTFFNAKKFFKQAEKERLKGKSDVISSSAKQSYTKTIEKASRLLELYPKSKYVDDALFLMGQSFFYQNEHQKAKRKFEELIDNFPKSEFTPEARLWLGKTNTQLQDYATAEKNFQDILGSKAKQNIIDEAQFLLGGLYYQKNDYIIALREYETAAKHASDKALRSKAYYQMGECYSELKDYVSAAICYEKARKFSFDPKTDYKSQFKAGLARKELKQYNEAIDIFTDLLGDINNEENWPQCKLEIADCLYLKGDIANAISWYESIVNDHKKTEAAAEAYFNLGLIYQKDKSDYKQAQEYYDLASKENSRAEIVPKAKANFNNIKTLLALKDDIKEQEKRIAAGDSVAATIDSLEVDTSSVTSNEIVNQPPQLEMPEREESVGAQDSSFSSSRNLSNYSSDSPEDTLDNRNFPPSKRMSNYPEEPSKNNNANTTKKVALKKGKLGTPKQELIKDKLMLAEIYLFEFNQPDSALLEYLDILQKDTSTTSAPKAIYSIAYIFDKYKNNKIVADSIYEKLIDAYPNTVYAEKARKFLNISKTINKEDIIRKKYFQAEKEYLENKNFKLALSQYEDIADNYPQSELASKSLFAMGWIYENELNENDKATEIYDKLLNDYPESNYAKNVKNKIDEVKKQQSKKALAEEGGPSPIASEQDSSKQIESEEKLLEEQQMAVMDKESYRDALRKEMGKDNRRLRNPKRIIK